jgi:serpin B
MSLSPIPLLFVLSLMTATLLAAEDASVPTAINHLGLDLFRAQAKSAKGNLLLSPYSIQNALAMTYAGADGDTRAEMQRVLHFPAVEERVNGGFADLAAALKLAVDTSKKDVENAKKFGGPSTPLEINVANRLFGQREFEFRQPFLTTLKELYAAPLEELDFRADPEKARATINGWVARQTKEKIREIVPPGAVKTDTRLAVANAIYLRAAWSSEFSKAATKPEPFHVGGKEKADVATMVKQREFGYEKADGYAAVSLPYAGGALQFLVILPDAADGLTHVSEGLTAEILVKYAKLPRRDVILHLPKFKLEPAVMPLGAQLQALGMKTAFDVPQGSANFDRMAPRKPNDYLKIGEVFHRTWLALDEQGTEAAAATVAIIPRVASAVPQERPKPIEVKVDRPFLFAIQHVETGTCLFLGRVTDPR